MYGSEQFSSLEDSRQVADELTRRLFAFVEPLLCTLDDYLDKRLVRTFFSVLSVIIRFRERANGLLLSELGGYLTGFDRAPAGTKRIGNLIRSKKWNARLVDDFLLARADEHLAEAVDSGEDVLMLWDDSSLEKPESIAIEGLCPVRSTKARRLSRIKPGYFRPPGPPVFVPGMHWVAACMLTANHCFLTTMRWWTSRGPHQSDRRFEHCELLALLAGRWGREIIHIFDRGFAGEPWIRELSTQNVRFILRWNKRYQLVDEHGRQAKAWKLCQGKRSQAHRQIWDTWRGYHRQIGLYQIPVTLPDLPDVPLYLVVSRQGQGRSPWYLLTNEPIESEEDGWKTIFRYARRWYVEQLLRVSKAELAAQSPRMWKWVDRLKMLSMLNVVVAFLLECLRWPPMVNWLLRWWCHRTGKRCREVSTPLYRLRSAISRLWLSHPPPQIPMPWESPG